ncbi:sporulation integral membrane protein YtvI [Cohnella laeviribosi]|uniref:sporulation integral membrane protein YtvI n=1 Tax=Cohnella laeviribosi TaxID=380174 RepID=UPI003D225DE4
MGRHIWGQWLRLIAVIAVAAGGAFFIWWALPLVYPFLLGWLLAYALNPLVDLLHIKGRAPRWLAVTIVLAVFTLAMLTVISALVMRLVNEIILLSGSLQHLVSWVEQSFNELMERPELQLLIDRINTFYQQNPGYQETINGRITDTAQALAKAGTSLIGSFLNGIVNVLSSLPEVATIAAIVLLASFFISKDWHRLMGKFASGFPEPFRKRAGTVWHELRNALFGYVRAQLIMITITAVVVTAGLIVIGVKNAVSIGMLIGLVDLLPYLGVGAAMIPWIAYVFLTGDAWLGAKLSILYGIVLVARQFIEPKVLASSVGLDPLSTLVAMFVGLKLFGFAGLIVGPVTLILLATCRRAGVFRDIGRFIVHGK